MMHNDIAELASEHTRQWALPLGRLPFLFAPAARGGAVKDGTEDVRILIVEDDYLVGLQVEAALKDAGFTVVGVASSANEALEIAASKRVSLAVMDIRIAGDRDGIETAMALFENHQIRCIFATAHSDKVVRKRADGCDPLGWLQKPYSVSSLVNLVREVTSK